MKDEPQVPPTAIDWQGKMVPRPTVRGTVLDHREDACLTLIQQGKDRFAVIYGLQLTKDLDYSEAAKEYGLCLFHSLTNQGLVK